MELRQPTQRTAQTATIAWVPLLVAALCSYGPVAYNYGFALYWLDWRHGFVKRGLVGELFSRAHFLTRMELLGIEYIFLAFGFVLTYLIFRPVLFGSAQERRLAAVLLSAPAALPHLGYLFAQPDITMYILVLGCLALFLRIPPLAAAAVSLPLCLLGLIAHEAFSLMFYPLVVAILADLYAKRRLPWWAASAHLAAMLLAFAVIVHWGALKVPVEALLHEAQARTNVPIQPQVYDVMASSLSAQRALVWHMYTPGVVHTLWLTLVLSAPYFTLLSRLLEGCLGASTFPRWQRLVTPALFLSPLVLCTLGHDTTRWIGAMCLDATLFLLYLYMTDRPAGDTRRFLADWAATAEWPLWLAYLIAIGPYGATGLRTAEQLIGAWSGP
ncbi:MAG: hypothetical protein NVSMB62_05980 [Acidobacteriaceae bacterium]